jgi:hypothetical protein
MALPSTQAAAVALLTTIVSVIVGFVPNLATYQSEIIAIGGSALSAVYLIANAIHAHADASVKVAKVQAGVK